MRRRAGILLHPTALPGPFGVGDLGPSVDRFLEWAQEAGFGCWQVLPLGPPEAYESPYSALSAFAGNPLLISPERLVEQNLLPPEALQERPPELLGEAGEGPAFEAARDWKQGLLRTAFHRFLGGAASPELERELEDLAQRPAQRGWLDDWALFSALRQDQQQRAWWDWGEGLAQRQPEAVESARRRLAQEIAFHRWVQLIFAEQWERVRRRARRRGILLLGDLPIYVAWNSAEVWSQRDLFELDEQGHPTRVAGVPPDAFTEDGQLWGNPLYRWDRMAEDGYRWWIRRVRASLHRSDLVRLDHFRGFAGYWAVPAGDTTARGGSWQPGPGRPLFDALEGALGELPLIAEDLGEITPDVRELLAGLKLPGMKILHFGFGDDDSEHAPHACPTRSVVYTASHDTDTSVGWCRDLDEESRLRLVDYAGVDALDEPHRALLRLAYGSAAELAITPVQDVLGLGSEGRFNTPGQPTGNWTWRLREGQLTTDLAKPLARLARLTGRSAAEAESGSSGDG